jgi:hypothetical protein
MRCGCFDDVPLGRQPIFLSSPNRRSVVSLRLRNWATSGPLANARPLKRVSSIASSEAPNSAVSATFPSTL